MKQIITSTLWKKCATVLVVFFYLALHSFGQNLEADISKVFDGSFKTDEPGGSILIQKGGRVLFQKNYGVSNIFTQDSINGQTIFNTGSISKTFVSNAILILAEKGKLSIEDPITKYFDDFKNPAVVERVKIKHLLSHTSGLPDLRRVSSNRKFYLTAKDAENFEPLKNTVELNFIPGSQFQYSNPAYNGLALIIEKVTGEKWQKFVRENIFIPAGMTKSKITDGPYPADSVAHAYNNNGREYIESDYGEFPTFAAAGNGGVWSTVHDLALYEQALRGGEILEQKTVGVSRTPFKPDNWSSNIDPFLGYGWFIGEESLFYDRSDFGFNIYYHTGSQGGFRAFFISIPSKDILYVGLFNRPVPDMHYYMLDALNILDKYGWGE